MCGEFKQTYIPTASAGHSIKAKSDLLFFQSTSHPVKNKVCDTSPMPHTHLQTIPVLDLIESKCY